jgi:peptidyl-prolyl cis-trans isomerase C
MTIQRLTTASVIFVLSATVAGCGRGDNPRVSQAVAKVDGYEVTVHEVNDVLSRLTPQASSTPEKLQANALATVIDRRLLVAQATKAKLDRNPETMQALATAHDEVLAQAYMRSLLTAGGSAAAGVKEYYDQNPQLFANRKLYVMKQIVVTDPDPSGELAKVVDASQSIEQVAAWLQSKSIKFEHSTTNRSTADFPPQLVANLDKLADKKLFVIKQPGRDTIASLTFIKDIPVSLAEASEDIQRYLSNEKAQTVVADELKRLRAAAKIEYLNGSAPQSGQAVADSNNTNAPSANPAASAGSAPKVADADDSPATHLTKGAAGLR